MVTRMVKYCHICRSRKAHKSYATSHGQFCICYQCRVGIKQIIEETLFNRSDYAGMIRSYRGEIDKLQMEISKIRAKMEEKKGGK